MEQENTINFCPECGHRVKSGETFCGNCGTKIIGSNFSVKNENTYFNPSAPIIETPATKSNNKKFNKKILIPIISVASALFLFGIALVVFIFLTSTHIICINHDWEAPTCLEPAKCTYCDKYKDDKLGNHKWIEATCTKPKTCSECSKIEGEALGHVNGKWTVAKAATFYEAGTEELSCTRCEEVIDSRTIARKAPKVNGKTFNFTDDEFIDWIEDFTKLKIGSKQSLNSDMNTAYLITLPSTGETGAIVFNHGSNGLNGAVCGIMMYFDNHETAILLMSALGEKMSSNFVGVDAYNALIQDKQYVKSSMIMMNLDIDNMNSVLLAPTEAIIDIIS